MQLGRFNDVIRRYQWRVRWLCTIPCSPPHANCWKCRKALDCKLERFFCGSCRFIQPPVKCVDYFQYLDQRISFGVDSQSLAVRFKNLQRQLHPDRFTRKSLEEQNYSAQQSSLVNKAYSTLSQPLSRALYLLGLHGRPLDEDDGKSTEPEFLDEMFELNERLAECQTLDDVRRIGAETKKVLERLKSDLLIAFDKEKNVDKARKIVIRMKFYVSLEERVNSKLGLG